MVAGFSGCDFLRDAGLIPDDEPAEESAPEPKPPPLVKPEIIEDAANEPSIKAKFGFSSSETDAVTETFNKLSAFIKMGGLDDNVIQLGDWIDLEGGLQVAAYPGSDGHGGGGFTRLYQDTVENTGDERLLLRLIVVGINSFQKRADYGYVPPEGSDHNATPHVVFQFQNIPGERRMNPGDNNTRGYAASEMREYLAQLEGKEGSGRFFAGLIDAGVPEEVLWAPKRIVSVKGASGSNEIRDLLWLPTERELFGEHRWSVADETANNQARLEYYDSTEKLKKHQGNGNSYYTYYWEASPSAAGFCHVNISGESYFSDARAAWGFAPAFCVQ